MHIVRCVDKRHSMGCEFWFPKVIHIYNRFVKSEVSIWACKYIIFCFVQCLTMVL